MVLSASVSGTGAVKRPLSSMQESCTGWESAPPMGAPLRTSFNLPFAHYALIYLDNMGKLKVAESPSIQEQCTTVFTPDVREKFLEILGPKIGYHKPLIRRVSGPSYGYNRDIYRQGKRRKASAHDPALEISFSDQYSDPVEEVPPFSSTNMAALEIGDTEKVLEYYETALKHFQQINCRQIAKAFIKFIEPRKQVKHPYNGGRPRAGAPPGEKGDPEKTKPEWWPAGVQHKEPDHLKKEQRLRLLIHILRKLGKFGITSDKLQEVAHDSKRQLRPEEKMEILNEIFRVRRLEERYERGEVDATTVVYVLNRDANPKENKDNESVSDTEKVEAEDQEDVDDGLLTPPSSSEQLTSSFTSIDTMSLGQSRSFHMGGERNQIFPLPESLSFEQPRQERPYYTTPAEYSEDYTHPIIKANPATSGMVSPHEQPAAYDYLAQASFTSSSGDHHRSLAMPMQHHVGHFDNWTPSFRQNMYNPMDYGASGQNMSQPPMHYQMPMNPPSHVQDLPHGLPEPSREKTHIDLMNPRGSAFRPMSVSHSSVMLPHSTTV